MLSLTPSQKEALKRDGVRKNIKVHFPNGEQPDFDNENIVDGSFKFNESICNASEFKYGLSEASTIGFETVGVANILGVYIEVSCDYYITEYNYIETQDETPDLEKIYYIKENDEYYMVDHIEEFETGITYYELEIATSILNIPFGSFIVTESRRNHENMAHRSILAQTFDNLNNVGISGQHKCPYLNLPIEAILALSKKPFQMGTHASYKNATLNTLPYDISTFPYNSAGYSIGWGGIYNINYSRRMWITDPEDTNDGFIVNVHYDEWEEVENKANEIFNAYSLTTPNSNWIYAEGWDNNPPGSDYPVPFFVKITNNNALAYKQHVNFSKPICFIRAGYRWEITEPPDWRYRDYYIDSYPIFLESDKNIIISFDQAVFPVKPLSSNYKLEHYDIHIVIPVGICKLENDYVRRWIPDGTDYDTFYIPESRWPLDPNKEYIRPNWNDITIDSDSYANNQFVNKIKITNTLKFRKDSALGDYYTYSNAFSYQEMLNGALELNAMVMKKSRLGGLENMHLRNTVSAVISRSEYEELWFDEYDVKPIGTVLYPFIDSKNKEQIGSYTFGPGESIYDMTDNLFLKSIPTPTQAYIESLLDYYFIPHLVGAFVPVDLTMKFLPYIEAGDLLEIETEDGVTVRTYVMNQEISGIQYQNSTITSVDGETIDSEVT